MTDKKSYDAEMAKVQAAHGIKVKKNLDAAEKIHTAEQNAPIQKIGKIAEGIFGPKKDAPAAHRNFTRREVGAPLSGKEKSMDAAVRSIHRAIQSKSPQKNPK